MKACKTPGGLAGLTHIAEEGDIFNSVNEYISQDEYLLLMESHNIDPLYYDWSGTFEALGVEGKTPDDADWLQYLEKALPGQILNLRAKYDSEFSYPRRTCHPSILPEPQGIKVSNRMQTLLESIDENPADADQGFCRHSAVG